MSISDEYRTPEDIKVERLREIEADPLHNIIKNQEIILKMLEDVLELLKDIKYPQWRDNATANSFTVTSDENDEKEEIQTDPMSLAAWKEEATRWERLYRDLLARLGVNGHEGAIAEIIALREKANLLDDLAA